METDTPHTRTTGKTLLDHFLGLNIGQKMLLAYLPLAVLLALVSIFALSGLLRINSINNSILTHDIPLAQATDRLLDNLLSQELYGKRHLILDSQEMLKLFWGRSKEFEAQIAEIEELATDERERIELLSALHKEHDEFFVKRFELLKKPSRSQAKKYDEEIKERQVGITETLKELSAGALAEQKAKTTKASSLGTTAFRVTAVICILGFVLGIGSATIITRNISRSIRQLNRATQHIAEGKFADIPTIDTQDELGELSGAFVEMGKRLKRLEEMYLDASPLTRLPGNIAIENVLKKRLTLNTATAFCLIDIDNFKSYNDHYGYSKGNEAILTTAQVVEEVLEKYGSGDDFFGHIGGDDFALITSPLRHPEICNAIIDKFDKTIPSLYNDVDRKRGQITEKNRKGEIQDYPIMTISIAVVTNQNRRFTNHLEVGELAAELKEYAKTYQRSIYVTDQRRQEQTQT